METAHLSKINFLASKMRCRCCGASPVVTDARSAAFCNFCEYYVTADSRAVQQLADIQDLMQRAKWDAAIAAADKIVANDDPYLLYGLGSVYMALSDRVYNNVNYSLPGFMEQNAGNRSNEPVFNKKGSMYLASKAKESFFRLQKVLSGRPQVDGPLIYLEFLSNLGLSRKFQALKCIVQMAATQGAGPLLDYSKSVYSVEFGEKDAGVSAERLMKTGETNALYYSARELARKRQFSAANRLLDLVLRNMRMPKAEALSVKIRAVEEAQAI